MVDDPRLITYGHLASIYPPPGQTFRLRNSALRPITIESGSIKPDDLEELLALVLAQGEQPDGAPAEEIAAADGQARVAGAAS